MPSRSRQPDELDSPWKEALEHFLEPFLGLCFPQVHAGIDWTRGYESLDKELQQIVRDAKVRKRVADKLFKVWRRDGREAWLLVHIEVQGQRDSTFPERMFVYHYRIYDRYRRTIVSLAALCDEHAGWRPDHFSCDEWGCKVGIWFPIVKILDYRGQEEALEQSPNPFAAIILAQLKVLETRQAQSTRWQWKLRIVKGLYDRGLTREQVRQLFRVIDWMLALPPDLEQAFRVELGRFEEERHMPYVTSVERLARQEGRDEGLAEGLQKGVLALLRLRFDTVGAKVARKVRSVHDVKRLEAVMRTATDAKTIDEAIAPLG
jgi:hypothetical protein